MPKQTFFNISKEKRNRIIDVSLTEFENNTFDNANINNIVKNAKIAKGSFYQYFEDKKDLYFYILELIAKEKLKYISEVLKNPLEHDFFTLVREMYSLGIKFSIENPRYTNIGNMLLKDQASPRYNEVVENNMGKSYEMFENLIKLGIVRGDIRKDIDSKFIAYVISEMNLTLINYYTKFVSNEFSDKLFEKVDEMIQFLKFVIGAVEAKK
jgi:AcrR family transcriptional regulator